MQSQKEETSFMSNIVSNCDHKIAEPINRSNNTSFINNLDVKNSNN